MAALTLITAGHVSTSPRVVREATSLAEAGHDVTVLGVTLEDAFVHEDARYAQVGGWTWRPVADIRRGVDRIAGRLRRRVAAEGLSRGWWHDPHVYSYAYGRLEAAALATVSDYRIVHIEAGLFVAAALQRARLAYGIDVEDWYDENRPSLSELSPERVWLRGALRDALRGAQHITTTSGVMADALAAFAGVHRPVVVYNGDSTAPLFAAPSDGPLRVVWCSQTVGPGRGLEDLWDALHQRDLDLHLTLIGRPLPGMRALIARRLSATQMVGVHFAEWVAPKDLAACVGSHHVGLAPEIPDCRNRQLTIANKVVLYAMAGLAVAATDTPGQMELLDALPPIARTYRSGDHAALGDILQAFVASRDTLAAQRRRVHEQATALLSREAQAARLLACIPPRVAR